MTNVTIFKDLGDTANPHHVPLYTILSRIKNGNSRTAIELIREKALQHKNYERDKKSLPFVLFSAASTKEMMSKGKPTHRLDECITEHSGIFVIDFDKCDVDQTIQRLKRDPYILACWVAPSGMGVKGLVKCPPSIENHDLYYTAFLDRYPSLDPTSRNISRGTFESYDPNIFFNEKSLVWDKRMSEEQRRKNKEKDQNKRGTKVIATAVAMVRSSYDGIKHDSLRNAAVLLGGYIATGRVNEEEAIKVLEEEIALKGPKDMDGARQTIRDGIEHGKNRPLHETKKIEKAQEYLTREDGSFEFLADENEMMDYEVNLINGTLPMGLPTGLNGLNEHWMLKQNHLVIFCGIDGTGKTFVMLYLAVLAAIFHQWKFLIYSSENSDGQIRKKLKEYYLGKSLKVADDEELTIAHDFVKKHFKIMTSKEMHTVDEMLMKAEIVYDQGWEFDCFIAEPYNSFEVPPAMDLHRHALHAFNRFRVFKSNYSSIWLGDHVNSTAARNRDKDGYVKAPWKADVDQGQVKSAKVDDFIVVHRLTNHPERKYETELHVSKIRDRESGGSPTEADNPVILQMNIGFCGYSCEGQDPIQEWHKNKSQHI